MIRKVLQFIVKNNIADHLWEFFYKDTGRTWSELYDTDNQSVIYNDHITIWWDKDTMTLSMFRWMLLECDKINVTRDWQMLFHFYV